MNKAFFSCLVAGCCTITAAQATTYDAAADFSSLNTTTSTWSYRFENGLTRNGSYSLLSSYSYYGIFNPDQPLWGDPSTIAKVGINQSGAGATYTGGPAFTWPNGSILMHPGYGGLVLVSWLSPVTAQVNVNFSFSDLDATSGPYLSDGINWYVERNDSSGTLSAGGYNNGGASGLQTLTGISVTAGDRINFIVDPKAASEYDSTQFTATITPVPEPSANQLLTLLLMFTGISLWLRRPCSALQQK